jgi:nucleoside-diphosphate-sugar epimerase
MKKILLIGGNGYIGSRAYDYLLELGYDVTNVDLCWFGKIYNETLELDYKNLTQEEISKYTHVILLAGHSSVSMCAGNLYSCFNNNVLNFIDLINKLNDDQILIYSSTCAVYGNNSFLVTEDYPIKEALNFYDFTKINRENIAKLHPNKKLIGLRFGSVNGFSKNFRNENLINSLTLNSKNKSLTISNGDSMRSILGITDAYLAIEKIISSDFIENKIYNLTSTNDKIINFGITIQNLSNSKLTINDTFKTDYSFNCSNKLFETDYNFKFKDTTESIYQDIIDNYENIMFNTKRNKIAYD